METWKPDGETLHDRLISLVRRYIDAAYVHAAPMERMMMGDAGRRVMPRLEGVIRGTTEEQLREELMKAKEWIHHVIGNEGKTKHTSTRRPRKGAAGAGTSAKRKTTGAKALNERKVAGTRKFS